MKSIFSAVFLSLVLAQVGHANNCPADTTLVCDQSFTRFCFQTTKKTVAKTPLQDINSSNAEVLDQAQFDGVLPGPLTVSARQADPSMSNSVLNYIFDIGVVKAADQADRIIAVVKMNGEEQPTLTCRMGSH